MIGIIKSRKNESLYLISSILYPIVGMVNTVIASRYINPSDMGVINKYLLITTYTSFLQLGVYNGLNRNIAYFKAQGKYQLVQSMVDTSYLVGKIISLINITLSLSIFVYAIIYLDIICKLATFLLCVIASTTSLINHYDVTFRSSSEFGRLGKIKIKETLLSIMLIWTPILFNFIGYVFSYCIKQTYAFILRRKGTPFENKKTYSWESYKILLLTGLPMLIDGYLWTVFSVSDQTFIALNMSSEDMGLYNIARQCTMAIMIIPNAINTILYPKAADLYGRYNDKGILVKFWYKSVALYIVVMVPIALIGYYSIPFFIDYLVPKYSGGTTAAQISILTGLTYIYFGPGVIFGTLKKNYLTIVGNVIVLGLFWGITFFFPKYFMKIEDIAYLRLFLFVGLMFYSMIISYILIKK